jgi:hypothetical protein
MRHSRDPSSSPIAPAGVVKSMKFPAEELAPRFVAPIAV